MKRGSRRFRVALLVDDTIVPYPVKDIVDWIEAEPDLDLCGLVIHPAPQSKLTGWQRFRFLAARQGIYTAVSRAVFAVISRLEARLVARAPRYSRVFRSFDVGDQVPVQLIIHPQVSASGVVYRFSEDDVERVRGLDADVLIRGGNGILKGDILTAARCGIISLHHGDNRVNRGGPAGFWEVYQRQPYTGFIVQRLTEELDGGDVLFRGRFTTAPFFAQNKALLLSEANSHLKRVVRRVLEGTAEPEAARLYDHGLLKTPQLGITIRYLLRTAAFVGRKAVRRLLGYRWRWEVAYLHGDWRQASLYRSKRLPNPKGHFLADPFAFRDNGDDYLFVEDYSDLEGRGAVSAYRVSKKGAPERLGTIISEPFHLSFPYVFRHEGELYMVPESSSNRDVRLYRSTSFPLAWELQSVIMRDISAVDTMIFHFRDRFWMFTTITSGELGRPDSEFCIFSADEPSGPWTPHPLNPIFVDADGGRNGGMLRAGDRLFRVGQRHGFAQYGAGCSIYEIEELSENSYSERKVQDVEPHFMKGVKGIHHLHADGDLLTFDFVRNTRR